MVGKRRNPWNRVSDIALALSNHVSFAFVSQALSAWPSVSIRLALSLHQLFSQIWAHSTSNPPPTPLIPQPLSPPSPYSPHYTTPLSPSSYALHPTTSVSPLPPFPLSGHRNVIRHLGTSLRAQGEVAAWQLCALCLGDAPALLPDAEGELVLLGADHREQGRDVRQRRTFLAPTHIHLTEMYELARVATAGKSPSALLPGFHLYKLYYAQALCEMGRLRHAYEYCEAMAWALAQLPGAELRALRVSPLFLKQLRDLAVHLLAKSPEAASACTLHNFWDAREGEGVRFVGAGSRER